MRDWQIYEFEWNTVSVVSKKELNEAIELILVATILHNMAVHDPVPKEWITREGCDGQDASDDLPSGASENRRAFLRNYMFDSSF
ncbi:hypothetical protein JG687_00017453 [Phytophthora cactorum]|uniref:Uncharacterized protein n=1 Tax=Phytophthora cactorum TaxID=29920 RepID=A0A8T1TRB9_9STRA|nr:hypothetical protein JG687_00017453 [Phytophthora cactorum]